MVMVVLSLDNSNGYGNAVICVVDFIECDNKNDDGDNYEYFNAYDVLSIIIIIVFLVKAIIISTKYYCYFFHF